MSTYFLTKAEKARDAGRYKDAQLFIAIHDRWLEIQIIGLRWLKNTTT